MLLLITYFCCLYINNGGIVKTLMTEITMLIRKSFYISKAIADIAG